MKKFGTPIGAGPGSASEKVGLVADGTPLPVGRLLVEELGLVLFFFLLWPFCWLPWAEGFSPWLEPVGVGVVLDDPVVVLLLEDDPGPVCEGEVEVEVDVVWPDPDEVDELVVVELVAAAVVVVLVVVVTETAGVVELVGVHCSLSEATGPVIGRPMAEMGVPGATLTWKTRTWPLTRVTVTVQSSAEAVGIEPMANATKTALATASMASSLRRAIMAARLRPSRWCAPHRNNGKNRRRLSWTLLIGPERCNGEPSPAAI
jgi:hypothetical protein